MVRVKLLELPGDTDTVAGPDPVQKGVGEEGVEVAVMKDGDTHRVQRNTPLTRRRVLGQVLQQELLGDVFEPVKCRKIKLSQSAKGQCQEINICWKFYIYIKTVFFMSAILGFKIFDCLICSLKSIFSSVFSSAM